MTEKSPYPLPLSEAKKKKKKQKKSAHLKNPELKRLESLPWNESLPGEESFDFIVGSNEGGFLSLEEIDESDYRSVGGVPDPEGGEEPSSSVKIKKRKRGSGGDSVEEDSPTVEAGIEGKSKKRKKPKKKKRKVKEEEKKGEAVHESVEEIGLADTGIASEDGPKDSHAEDDDNESTQLDDDNESTPLDDEFHAWVELRLHPLLIKSIRRLGFKEPTPIQKACIPFAAHQGKDVVGAAETGSGKTLAFGLPILQRLLEERVKAARLHQEEGNATDEYIRGSHLRALIVTPTRELALQVSDHLKEVAKLTNISVVPIVGGMSTEKQERLLKRRPEIIVGTPGRLWELMSGGDQHLVELHSLSFFVLDEADRMIENGHFHELQSIIDLLPTNNGSVEPCSQVSQNCKTVPSLQRKKRQIFVFSATIALPDSFRKKLKGRHLKLKPDMSDELSSIERLSERAGMRADFEKVVLSNSSIVADKLEESFIECTEENKDAYLYYILSVHGHGRTIVFCTSIAALRRISSLLRILGINVWTLHAQMQQRARLKAIDRFRGTEHAILVATDVAARGLDIPGVRTVIHYQLPHSAEVYIHRSGRTARASADGCCIALISPGDRTKFFSLCKALLKESLKRFPLEDSYMPEVMKRVSLSRQIDKILRINSQENLKKSWFERNAESVELMMEESGSEEEQVENHKQKKISSLRLKKLLQELNVLLAQPFHPKTFSRRYLAGAGVSPLLQRQLEELTKQKTGGNTSSSDNKREKLVVIGQDCVEPLQALRSFGHEVSVSADKIKETRRQSEVWKRKKREDKKRQQEQRRKEKRKKKEDK